MKDKKDKIVIVGGDLRQIHLANLYSKTAQVWVYGFEKNSQEFENTVQLISGIEERKTVLSDADFLILPMPVMENDTYINAPFSDQKLEIDVILKEVGTNCIVYAGKITSDLQKRLESFKLRFYDYLEREELAIWNAVPTAEGTLQIVLEELPVTIYGLSVLLVGSGRISRVLWKYLKALGADVSVSARKHKDLSWIQLDGCHAIHTKELKTQIHNYDLIINTVPAKILDKTILEQVKPNALLIDLASKPGGVDFEVAKQLGLKTIWALSLPGKVAPLSAGEIIYNTISNMIEEWRE